MLDQIDSPSPGAAGKVADRSETVRRPPAEAAGDGLPTAAQQASAVAAYVIARFFSASAIRIRAEAHGETNWQLVALEPSLTVLQAARRIVGALGSAEIGELTLTPANGSEKERYRLRFGGANGNHVEVLSGPGLGTGRVVLSSMVGAIRHAVLQGQDDANRSLGSLDLTDDALRQWLTGACAGRCVPYPKNKTIAQRVAEQAAQVPQRAAITCDERTLCYGELNALVNGLARRFAQHGIAKGELVPVMLDNSLELPVTLLALMQIGAPFVIIDHSWPPLRIVRALRKLEAQRVIRGASVHIPVDAPLPQIVVTLDSIAPNSTAPVAMATDGAVRAGVTASDLIYGLFTSGSTGEPKCALNYHLGILNRFENMNRRFAREETGTILQTSKQVYDGFIWQLFWPLTRGARVIMPKHTQAPDPMLWVELIWRHQVTMTDIVPSIFKLLLRLLERAPEVAKQLASLRRILIGGEKINPADIAAFQHLCPNVSFTNTYGPTEASIGMLMHDVAPGETDFIPLGRPIDNTYGVIVDELLRPVPAGVIGELLIGGDCLGAGYFGDEQATARAMIVNPYAGIPGRKLYRTGDLAYLLPDGNFQFAGRIDDQVSIGGARVEIMEVEKAIAALAEVAEVSVIAHESRAGSTQLVAFVVPSAGSSPGERLREAILDGAGQTLPRNYLPHQVCFVAQIPLMENGKTDRRKLLSHLAQAAAQPDSTQAPELLSTMERDLAGIWCELLKLQRIGPDDNFFALGGDSLQALMLIVEVKHKFAIGLSLQSIFNSPTLRSLACLLSGESAQSSGPGHAAALASELFEDSELPPLTQVAAPRSGAAVRSILLTGVTGFVGAHLAESILAEPGTRLICAVRGESEYTCIARVASSLASHSFWQQKFIHRIRVVPCNLEQPWFGLPAAQFRALLGSVDAAIVNAANVHALYSYDRLRAVNVGSVRDILLNSLLDSGVPVHFISSLSVFTEQQQERLTEQTVPDVPPTRDGYAQSKWVADRLCLAASCAGAPVSVYRLGEMMSPLRTGLANETALSTHLLSTIFKLGVYPEKKVYLDYTPVDVAARIIVRAVVSGMVNKVYHICNNRPLGFDELSAMLASALGRHPTPQAISDQKFLELLRAACRSNPLDRDLRYVSELLPERAPEEGVLATLFTQNSRRCETFNVNALMAHTESVWPELNVDSLMATSHFFARRMFNVHAASASTLSALTELV